MLGNKPAATNARAKASGKEPKVLPGTIVKQSPAAGKKVVAGTTVYFEVKK
ncbi:MAG: PASTA domain-containing protein [Terriglobales bacterium]